MSEIIPNYQNSWRALQTEINKNKVEKVDFKKTFQEKINLHNAKLAWRKAMKAQDPNFKKRKHKSSTNATA